MDNKINRLLNDNDFKLKLDKLNTEEEISALFAENGVKVTFDYEDCNDEISEKSLENIIGGRIVMNPWIWKRIGKRLVRCMLIA